MVGRVPSGRAKRTHIFTLRPLEPQKAAKVCGSCATWRFTYSTSYRSPAGSLPAALVRCNVSCVSRHFAYGYILQQDRHAAVCQYGRSGRTILSAGQYFTQFRYVSCFVLCLYFLEECVRIA